jgi:hypothetical protein
MERNFETERERREREEWEREEWEREEKELDMEVELEFEKEMNMKFAFLFLTNEGLTHPDVLWNFVETQNIYIHPKEPQLIQEYFQLYVIDSLIKTKWGEASIVDATINLLKESYLDENNRWFVLLSQDAYPLHSFDDFKKKIYGTRSMFNLIDINGSLSKTSQWWILHRNDVKLILENDKEYRKIFTINKKSDGAFDEFYFLSLLRWLDPTYNFINKKVMYDEFQEGTIQKSPKIFNKLIECDIKKISGSFFIRKVTPDFTLNVHKTKKDLRVVYIGTETEQQNILSVFSKDEFDLFILSSIKIELIHPDILKRSICVIQIIYKFLLETILSLSYEKRLKSWDSILFTTEKYDLTNSNNNINGLSLNNLLSDLPFKNETIYPNIKQFFVIKDTNGNIAYYKKKKINYRVKKMRIPRDKYVPNLPTFRDWESPSNDDTSSPTYISSPYIPPSPPYIPPSPTNTSPYNDVPSPPFAPSSPPFAPSSPPFVPSSPPFAPSSPPFAPSSPPFAPSSPPFVPSSPPFAPSSPMNTPPQHNDIRSPIYTSSNNEPFIVPKCVRKPITPPPNSEVKTPPSPKRVMIKVKRTRLKAETPQPNGMTLKIGKKCPNGTKTHKMNDKIYCKTAVDKKNNVLSNNVVENNDDTSGLTIKVGKKCPKGTKTHKMNDKIYCKTVVDKKVKVLSNNVAENNDTSGLTLKIGKKCPNGSKTHKLNDKLYCKKVV